MKKINIAIMGKGASIGFRVVSTESVSTAVAAICGTVGNYATNQAISAENVAASLIARGYSKTPEIAMTPAYRGLEHDATCVVRLIPHVALSSGNVSLHLGAFDVEVAFPTDKYALDPKFDNTAVAMRFTAFGGMSNEQQVKLVNAILRKDQALLDEIAATEAKLASLRKRLGRS